MRTSSSRNVSPSPTNNHNHQYQQHVVNGNGNYSNGSNIELSESFSSSTLDFSLPPVVDAMSDKDTQKYAKYQGAHRKEAES